MRSSVRQFIESGKKFYAECGGLMYLAESIDDARMVGIVPARIEMTERLVDFGYCEIRTNSDSILGPRGTTARGHQFHYSRSTGSGNGYSVKQGQREYSEGFIFPNGIASYIHLHLLSNPDLARTILNSLFSRNYDSPLRSRHWIGVPRSTAYEVKAVLLVLHESRRCAKCQYLSGLSRAAWRFAGF